MPSEIPDVTRRTKEEKGENGDWSSTDDHTSLLFGMDVKCVELKLRSLLFSIKYCKAGKVSPLHKIFIEEYLSEERGNG